MTLRPRTLVAALAAALPALALAAPGSSSPYRTDTQNSHVEDATSRGVGQVNMITCFIGSMRPEALVNQPNYFAMVDKTKCDPEKSAGNDSSSSGAANAPNYMTATVNSSRSSNSEPMRVKVWADEKEQDFSATIFINISATEAPTANNPYGVFRMDYCGKGDSGGPCMMNGYLEGSADGISYFELEGDGAGGGGGKALRLTTSGTDSGAGMLQMTEQGQPLAYSFAYNASYFRRSDGTQDQCFSRDASDPETGMSVWRYGLYDASTGERVNRNSGFPIEFTGAQGQVERGQIGYWGLNVPPGVNIASGTTVQRVEYGAGQPTKTAYALLKADGRLMKYSKQTRTLAATDKLHFQTWVGDATNFYPGAQSNTQYEMYWDDSAGAFKVTATMECGNGPCQTHDLSAEQTVQPSFFAPMGGVRGWSQTLGGELFIPLAGVTGSVQSANVNVIYRTQDLVYPADMPTTLYCLRDCPTAASIGAYFADGSNAQSPFVANTFNNWMPSGSDAVVSYSTDTTHVLLKDGAGAAVTFTNRDALQSRPQYQHGLRTGRLFTDLAGAQCTNDTSHYCDYKVEEMATYYQWETGPNQWNQFAALKDGSGALVTFDAPLQVTYNVPTGTAYGAYAGKSIVLQYGGFGELWGIPGHCVSRTTNEPVSCEGQESRYVPAFVIPMDEVLGRVSLGGTPLLAKWLDREIRFARKDVSVCAAAGVTLPSGLTLPTASSLADPSDANSPIYIGARPVVTDAPRVIHGDVKF
ncbi:hypothetical protein [Ideonella sp. BN130291]|uniref:hypothetical protein n=1 Tax=Ideonella sp. BN130291 TaxID=3112940 RepID=UPI002E257DA4|nr:hypothetical protein [Ideonella sp. BN130291]